MTTQVIFACVHNAGRSQMSAAFFNALADPSRARAVSAGTEPGDRVHPEVVAAMREAGIDLSTAKPARLTDQLAAASQHLVTMGCGEACPLVPGLKRDDWPIEDPKGKPLERVRQIRDEIRQRVERLIATEGWAMPITTRRATKTDAEAIARIYNQGIEDRIATFETRPRTAEDVAGWFDGVHPIVVAEGNGQVVGFASTSSYRPRECYAKIAEFSVYVARDQRGRGVGRRALEALIEESRVAGLHKLVSRIFPENLASRAACRAAGFREVGTYTEHGQLEGTWKDCVIVERIVSS
jgi:L-amino acid N-acyltransferase YncA/protein-tyrosine-phosphatase